MSLVKSLVFFASLFYTYRLLSINEKEYIKKKILNKINKYKPKLIEIINLLDSFNDDEISGIRNEKEVNYKQKCDDLIEAINSFDENEIDLDLEEICTISEELKKSNKIKKTKHN